MPSPLCILYLEDNPSDAELVALELKRDGFEADIRRVETRVDFEAALAGPIDLILADYSVPSFTGLDAIHLLQQRGINTPVILISGTIGEEEAVEAMKAGAFDYLLKGKLARLGVAVSNALHEKWLRAEKRTAESALRSSEERYRILFESNPMPMWVYNTATLRFLAVNDAAVEHYGYTRGEFLSMTIEDIRPAEEIPRLRSSLEQPVERRQQARPWKHRKKDGTLIDVEVLSYDLDTADASSRLVLANDITEKRRAEQALRESEQRYQALFEDSPISIWEEDFSELKKHLDDLQQQGITNFQQYFSSRPEAVVSCARLIKILDVNRAALKMYKAVSKEELLASTTEILSKGEMEHLQEDAAAIAEGRTSNSWEGADETLTGEPLMISLSWSVAPGHESDFSKVVVTTIDITERKRTEEMLQQRDEELQLRNFELERLYRSSESLLIGALADLPTLAQNIVETLLREFEQSNCSLLLVNKETRELERIAVAGPYATHVSRAKLSLDKPGLVARAVRRGHVMNVADVSANPDYVPNWEHARSELVIPLKVADEVIGALDVQSPELEAFHADDERLMTIFAERAAFGLERTRLYEQTRKQLERLESLRTIDLAISNSLDLRISLNIVLEQVIQQLGVDAASVLLLKPGLGRLEYFVGRGFRTREIESTSLRMGEGYAGRAAMEKQIVHVTDLGADNSENSRRGAFRSEEFISYFGVPLIARGEVKGVLEIFHRKPIRADMEWLNFLDSLGWQTAIAVDNALLFEGVQRSNFELAMAYDETIEGWSKALDLRDKETEGHTRRVTEMTLKLAEAMGFHGEDLAHIRRGALLHDIGKMGVPDHILLKPDALTDEEWISMKRHPQFAFEMLQPIAYLRPALHIPYCHHEKWDGTGYPRGLAGMQIPLEARLFAVVDVWDAITSDRPYRKKWPKGKALKYIREQSGKHFDPQVVEKFLEEMRDLL